MLSAVMNRELVCVDADTLILDVARIMESKNVGCVLVTDSRERPIGILSDRDIVIRCIAREQVIENCTVGEMMTESPVTVHEGDGVLDCIRAMRETRVRRMPVVDDEGCVVGIVSFGDLVAILGKELAFLAEAGTLAADEPDLERFAA